MTGKWHSRISLVCTSPSPTRQLTRAVRGAVYEEPAWRHSLGSRRSSRSDSVSSFSSFSGLPTRRPSITTESGVPSPGCTSSSGGRASCTRWRPSDRK